MKRKNKIFIFAIIIFVVFGLTGCKGQKINDYVITYSYDKRIESIGIKNEYNQIVYTDFSIVLLDKNNEILYKKPFKNELLKEGINYYNLEDAMPEFLSFDKVDSMHIEEIEVYKISYLKIIILLIAVIITSKEILELK